MGLSLALVGCGSMGSALLKGWLTLPNSHDHFDAFSVIDPHPENILPFQQDKRVSRILSPDLLPSNLNLIVFAIKPSSLEETLPLYAAHKALVISVAAGKSLSFYENFFPENTPIARAMPNLPVSCQQGIIGLLPNKAVTSFDRETLTKCFSPLGFTCWVETDDDIQKLTAISASGPAYVYSLIEAFTEAIENMGFQKPLSDRLALHTFLGACQSVNLSGESPSHLREKVTSPQGTTAAALEVLGKGKLSSLFTQTIEAAYQRAKELSQ